MQVCSLTCAFALRAMADKSAVGKAQLPLTLTLSPKGRGGDSGGKIEVKNMCFCETNRIDFRVNSVVNGRIQTSYEFGGLFLNPVRLERFRSLAGVAPLR